MRHHIVAFVCVFLVLPVLSFAGDLSAFMPKTVGEMHRIQLITGEAAQKEVDKLHGKTLQAEASAVARYSKAGDVGELRPAEVWLSQVSSEKEARRQTGLMVHKMYENPKSPFKNPMRIEHNGQSVYRFSGMGQTHFIWFKGNLVYWVSSNAADTEMMLNGFCR